VAETIIDGVAGLKALVGKELGRTRWREMTFEAIERFADATGDRQWIHVDRERIARESPFGKPVAHGYFTLSLIGGLFSELVETRNFAMAVNYGLNKVRFPTPLKAGQRYRLSGKLGEVKESGNTFDAVLYAAIEVEGEEKPACAAELIVRFVAAASRPPH
jgi:acyl dehydratase